jgi:hypothetical protein
LSLRINLGAAFRELFKGEEVGINVVFKTTRNLFSLYVRSRQICGWMALLL